MKFNTLLRIVAAAIAATGFTAAAATPTLRVDHGILTGADGVSISGSLYDVRFVDGTCNAVFTGCSSSASFTFRTVDAASAAASALVSTVLVDGPDGLFDTDQDSIFGCGDRTTCAVFVPYLVSSATAFNFTSIAALDYAGSGDSRIGEFARRRATDTTGNTQEVFAVFMPSVTTGAVPEPGPIALLGIGTLGAFGATRNRRRAA